MAHQKFGRKLTYGNEEKIQLFTLALSFQTVTLVPLNSYAHFNFSTFQQPSTVWLRFFSNKKLQLFTVVLCLTALEFTVVILPCAIFSCLNQINHFNLIIGMSRHYRQNKREIRWFVCGVGYTPYCTLHTRRSYLLRSYLPLLANQIQGRLV
jgi:hypothetical protein